MLLASKIISLVGGDWNMFFFPFVGNGIIIPTDEIHDFSEVGQPPTSIVTHVVKTMPTTPFFMVYTTHKFMVMTMTGAWFMKLF